MKRKDNSGQALLIILLIMAVALTIGLSVISRSITDIRISQEQEESARAFSAAEAGLEHYLATGTAPSEDLIENFKIETDIEPLGDSSTFVFPEEIRADDTQTVWLVNHLDEDTLGTNFYGGNSLTLYWGNSGQASGVDGTPAIEAILLYNDGGYKTWRKPFDPYTGTNPDRTGNNFDSADVGSYSVEGKNFPFRATIDLPSGDKYALRLKLIYNSEPQSLAVTGDANFPLQGTCYASTAFSETTGISRKVEQCQFYPSLSGIFDYVLFSESSL